MAAFDRRIPRFTLAAFSSLLLGALYLAMPEGRPRGSELAQDGDDTESDPRRVEILDVSPRDPFRGSTISIVHTPVSHQLSAYMGKTELRILARKRESDRGELVAELPRDIPSGDLKLRIASAGSGGFSERAVRSKPHHLWVREPDYRKVFRHLTGGVALMLLGIHFLSRGVRAATGMAGARLLTRVSERRGFVLALGALLGTVTQTTTGAAGILAGLVSARVLAPTAAAVAFLATSFGAALVPLSVAGLVEPRDGLLLVTMGVAWWKLSESRRAHAYARLLLGTGFVAFGLQIFRPALEPFLADAFWWSLVERMHSASTGQLGLCALFGALCVGALHGPAPLIVLALGLAQASGNFSLPTLLALLSGSAFGAALGALITAPAGHRSRHFSRLNLLFGGAVSVLAFVSVPLWVAVSEHIVGKLAMPLHWSTRMPMPELGLRLLVGFGASQLACVLLLSPLVERVAVWLEERSQRASRPASQQTRSPSSELPALAIAMTPAQGLRSALDGVLARQQHALASMVSLTCDGLRRHGDEAEQTLAAGRAELETLLAGPVRELAISSDALGLPGAAFAAFQLQHTLERLLETAERMVDARLEQTTGSPWRQERARTDGDEPDVRESSLLGLHRLVFEGIDAARDALRDHAPLDLDAARAREIQLNRLEAEARAALLDVERVRLLDDSDLHVLEVVGAYEVSGNHVYRLAEVLGQTSPLPSLTST